ncbi:TRAP transporter large permease [Salipiger sp. P9]|uniref:TRAP transporter large permease n=1 Tax=Salipiger pentaromativorans TaxID=2943193 RepID=UPI002157FD66|nr:TRAP transporter large permease [Salipiger pentaromativorans]MCR8551041.1 TRAP transporter large permease [Salipiger pentaromativorans]
MIAAILFGLFCVLLLMSVPIAVALGSASAIALFVAGKVSNTYIPQALVTSIDSFPLMAVPFFILAGDIMARGGLSERLLKVGGVLFGRFRGGMAIIAVVTCMFFAAISGSGPATVAAVGSILLPVMAREGYRPAFSTGLVASSGCLGVIIPPSVPMIIYAASANVSVSGMFLAGIVPGLLIAFGLIAYALWQARRDGIRATGEDQTARDVFAAIWEAKWALLAPGIILGGIYGGIFTPTEAAAVGVIYGLVVSMLIYRELSFADLYRSIAQSALTTGTVMVIVGTATIFGRVLTIERIPVILAESMTTIVENPIVLLLLINLLLLVVGTFLETLAAIIILTPILLPVALAIGVDPTHFGIVMIVNLAIGMITPPLGLNLFIGARVGKVPIEKLIPAMPPFVLTMVLILLALTYIPALSLALPSWASN